MPVVALSWDLAVVVFFAILMSLGFILGKNRIITVIIASYIAVIATEGIGRVLARLTGHGSGLFESMGVPVDPILLSLAKIFLFALCAGVFVLKSGIDVSHKKDAGSIVTIVLTGLLGFSLSGLIASTILSYAAGSSLLTSGFLPASVAGPQLHKGTLAVLLILNQDLWYALPAFLIVTIGFIKNSE
ncbi:MAG: hypothetical protein PHZ00_00325 [Candidatus Peribacteraceae bacterium]|nr:hypothetical protein [Candidatus Peribacteraceae bacterium]